MISLCRSLLRQEGLRVPSGGAVTFARRVRALELPSELRDAVEPLLKSHEDVCAQIDLVDKKVEQAVKDDERVQRLTSAPRAPARAVRRLDAQRLAALGQRLASQS
jgi:transposase